jgi:FimV-like protein
LSVENPSKVLEQYPDLEFSDEASLVTDDAEDELEVEDITQVEHSIEKTDDDTVSELEALDETDFDTLLADYAQTEPEVRLADEQIADVVLTELTSDSAQPVIVTESPSPEEADAEDLEFSLLALDKLLDDSEEESELSPSQLRSTNLALEDYQDFIAAQHEPELDPAEQGFAADLDLIRAYIEIGEQDGAQHLIDKVLSSAAPEHIKQEAQSLKDQL